MSSEKSLTLPSSVLEARMKTWKCQQKLPLLAYRKGKLKVYQTGY